MDISVSYSAIEFAMGVPKGTLARWESSGLFEGVPAGTHLGHTLIKHDSVTLALIFICKWLRNERRMPMQAVAKSLQAIKNCFTKFKKELKGGKKMYFIVVFFGPKLGYANTYVGDLEAPDGKSLLDFLDSGPPHWIFDVLEMVKHLEELSNEGEFGSKPLDIGDYLFRKSA